MAILIVGAGEVGPSSVESGKPWHHVRHPLIIRLRHHRLALAMLDRPDAPGPEL